ncbi:MAG: excinuclease ABC subunit UvrC [Thermoplasmata archaeon]|nr:excinuclease ABC subunit UvrC [Thermoplasmata archaeon]MCI4362000.1 excinuclease ABC subunit UvrC [Thermoplasmata archaeon]
MTGPSAGPTGFVPASELRAADADRFHPGPSTPGVYLFRSPRGEVIYVGKALRLRRRILDHLHARVEKDGSILAHSGSVEFVPTVTEREALLLEASLIKQYQPPYNTLLKDDRSYPYLAITVGEAFPRVLLVRRPRRSNRYLLFGPYTSAREARSVAQLLTETFRLRRCIRLPKRECLYYHIGACPAPCIGEIGVEAYRVQVDGAIHALKRHGEGLAPALETEMRAAAVKEEFERAALLRDALEGFKALTERQNVIGVGAGRADVVALAYPTDPASLRVAVGLLHIVDGEVRGTEPHLMAVPPDDVPEAGELLRQFLTQYYGERLIVPDHIYIQGPRPDGIDDVVDWLEGARGIPVGFRPTGRNAALASLAERLARATVDQVVARAPPRDVLVAVQRLLQLPTLPNRIEGIDISIFQGSEGVASLVVFERGAPAKSEYRRYKIRTVEGTNDFASIAEVVRRRFPRRAEEGEPLPDLLLIDGGRGQLGAAMEVLKEAHLDERIPAIGLAKREEEVYLPDRSEPLKPNRNAPPMLLLRSVRDEAHRFAVTYHRTRRRMRLREEFEEAGEVPVTSRSSSGRARR